MSGAFWIEPFELTQDQKKEFNQIIPSLTKANIDDIERLIKQHKSIDKNTYIEDGLTPGELRNELETLRDHYKRALKVINYVDEKENFDEIHLIDQSHMVTTQNPFLLDLHTNQGRNRNSHSGLEIITQQIIQAIDDRIQLIEVSKEQRGSKRFAFFINILINIFESTLPDIKINTADGGPFFTLTNYILCEVFEAAPKNAKRQIDKVLELRKQHPKK